jgi:hypothetical protein
MKGCMKEFEKFLKLYIKSRSISLLREEPHVFASRIFTFFSSLSFPHTEDHFLEGVKGKALHCLWSAVTNDILNNTDKSEEHISDSLQVVTKYRNGMNYSGKTESGQIMHDFIQRFYNLPSGPNRKIAKELLFLDLTKIINGFDYERVIQENDATNTLSEYIEFGAVTIDLRVYLDIDIALYPYNMNPSTIGDLREAYKWFSLAFKLSSDITNFEREYFAQRSCNAIILYGKEKGVLSRDIFRADVEYKENLYERVTPALIIDIEDKGREYLSKSIECLEKLHEMDMRGIAETFITIFENHLVQKTFSPPGT